MTRESIHPPPHSAIEDQTLKHERCVELPASVTALGFEMDLRRLEALLFSCREPLKESELCARLGSDVDLKQLLEILQKQYHGRGIELVFSGAGWRFRTAPDLAEARLTYPVERRKLSRAAMEALTVIAYHQPITRAEIDAIRGVANGRSALDALLETGWIRAGARRRAPGRPLTWITTEAFLDHFAFESLDSLPGVDELTASGLLNLNSGDIILSEQMANETGEEAEQFDLDFEDHEEQSSLFEDRKEL